MVQPSFGIFVENRLRHLLKDTDISATVIAPVPWFPFKKAVFGRYGEAARVPGHEKRFDIDVFHPRFFVVPKIGARLTPWFLYRCLLKQIKDLAQRGLTPDLLDAHYLYPDGVAAAMVGQALNIPVVMTARGSDVTEIAQMPGFRERILWATGQAEHVITVSNSLRNGLLALGVRTPVTTLRNGVDTDRFSVSELQSRTSQEKIRIVFAGWLIPRKRVDLVLETVAMLPNAEAVIIGSGPEEQTLRKQAETLGIEARVDFLGQQAPEEMPKHFAGADVLMLPSEREGWANVLLEAMACGTPVVASAVDGAIDLVTEDVAGRLVPEQDASAYAQAVEAVLASRPARQDVRAFALRFGWRDTSMGQKKIFDLVATRHGGREMENADG